MLIDDDGWNYENPTGDGDCRKAVTLLDSGMVWVGIRAWHSEGVWFNGNEPEQHHVLAWRDLPNPAKKRWVRGLLL